MSRRWPLLALTALLAQLGAVAPAEAQPHGARDGERAWRGVLSIQSAPSGARIVWALELAGDDGGRLRTHELRLLECAPPAAPPASSERPSVTHDCRFDPLAYYHCVFDRCLSGAGRCLEDTGAAPTCLAERCRETFEACFELAAGCAPRVSPR